MFQDLAVARRLIHIFIHGWLLELSKDNGAVGIHLHRPVVPRFLSIRKRGQGLDLESGWVVGKHGFLSVAVLVCWWSTMCSLALLGCEWLWGGVLAAGISSRGRVECSGFPRIAEPAPRSHLRFYLWWVKALCTWPAWGTSGLGHLRMKARNVGGWSLIHLLRNSYIVWAGQTLDYKIKAIPSFIKSFIMSFFTTVKDFTPNNA